jgi:hypothetical protein
MNSLFGSILGIVICGGLGGVSGWMLVGWLGLDGVPGAMVAAGVGMVGAVAAFAAMTSLLRALGWTK